MQPAKKISKAFVEDVLHSLNYFESFKQNYLHRSYPTIDYGKRLGKKTFSGLLDASKQYGYNSTINEDEFIKWHTTLNDEDTTNEELLYTILEIFDWGGVLRGNVKVAVDLFRNKNLKTYIHHITTLLKTDEIITKSGAIDIRWSSGWTKVYSFINNDILIYDSRVSAFINHTLTYHCAYDDRQLSTLKALTKYLFNFGGVTGRERMVDKKSFGFKNTQPNGLNGFNANLMASWIAQLINEQLYLNYETRVFDRAFFMLGFDLEQLTKTHP